MSSKFNQARPAGKKPPICKGKRPPRPDATPAETFPIISGQPLTIAIAWSEISPRRPWSIKETFYVNPSTANRWRIDNVQRGNVQMNLSLFYTQSSGLWWLTGSIKVDGILEDTIVTVFEPYVFGQPFQIPFQTMKNTHPQTPTPASISFGAVLQ